MFVRSVQPFFLLLDGNKYSTATLIAYVRRGNERGTLNGLGYRYDFKSPFTNEEKTYVNVRPALHARILVFFASQVSPENCASSLTSILNWETIDESVAIPSASKNLQEKMWIRDGFHFATTRATQAVPVPTSDARTRAPRKGQKCISRPIAQESFGLEGLRLIPKSR